MCIRDSLEDVLGGGVHGLSAGDDAVHSQVMEDLGQAGAGADRHESEGLLRRRDFPGLVRLALLGGLGQDLGVLSAHILDLHGLKRAVGDGLLQHFAGMVGMDVDLSLIHI